MSKPGPTSRSYTIRGARQDGRRRHLRLVPREQETRNDSRFELRCIRCLAPREKRSFPICERCQSEGPEAA